MSEIVDDYTKYAVQIYKSLDENLEDAEINDLTKAVLKEVGIHKRAKELNDEKSNSSSGSGSDSEKLATEKQMNYLGYLTEKLDKETPKDLTKEEASNLIEKYKAKVDE